MMKMLIVCVVLIHRVTCSSNTSADYRDGELRIVGEHPFTGRVEVYYNNKWGTVCDDGWDLDDAKVACRQLGFKGAYAGTRQSFFGNGEGPIHFDNVACVGNESLLFNCARSIWHSNCNHDEDAGVICKMSGDGGDKDVRLVNGNSTAGRVEIFINDQWGTVCDDFWDIKDARVVCRQLGFSHALAAHSGAFFGEGVGQVHIDDVNCYGNETSLTACSVSFIDNCDHSEDAGVSCEPFQIFSNFGISSATVSEREPCNSTGAIRLINGNSTAGQIHICMEGQWGSICNDNWDIRDAEVVCRQIGFKNVYSIPRDDFFQKLEGSKHIFDINCFGQESDLLSCNYSRQGICEYESDASVSCDIGVMTGSIRLVGGNNTAGRVEIFLGVEWGTICDDDWDIEDAKVVCTQLGFMDALSAPKGAAFGLGNGPIHITAVECSGNETLLIQCKNKENPDCRHNEDSGVVCSDVMDWKDHEPDHTVAPEELTRQLTIESMVGIASSAAVLLLGCFATCIYQLHKHHRNYILNQELQLGRRLSSQRPLPNVPSGGLQNKETYILSTDTKEESAGQRERCESNNFPRLQKRATVSSGIYTTISEDSLVDTTVPGAYVPMDGVKTYSERIYT